MVDCLQLIRDRYLKHQKSQVQPHWDYRICGVEKDLRNPNESHGLRGDGNLQANENR